MGKLRGPQSHTKGHDRAKGLVEGGGTGRWEEEAEGRGMRLHCLMHEIIRQLFHKKQKQTVERCRNNEKGMDMSKEPMEILGLSLL